MRRLLKISGFILILMLMLSLEISDQWSSNFFAIGEAEAFGRRNRLFDTGAEAQTTTQSTGTGTEVETESNEVPDQSGRSRSRRRGTSKGSTGTTEAQGSPAGSVSKRTAEPAASTVPIGTVVRALPAGCQDVVFNGVSYSNCEGTYYRAAFQGSNLVYVTVDKPQQ